MVNLQWASRKPNEADPRRKVRSMGMILALLCVAAGFLVIAASVVFVIKGKAILGESGTLNRLEWGKLKANLTSVGFLFFLGAILVALPFWRVQQEEALQRQEQARQTAMATLRGKVM